MKMPLRGTTAVAVLLGLAVQVCTGVSLQERIDALPAGDTLRLEAGIHEGPLRITKAATIEGGGVAIIDGMRNGSVITIDAADVRLRGLVIRNSGLDLEDDNAGILVLGDSVELTGNRIESCLHGIYLKKVKGGLIEGNTVTGARASTEGIEDLLTEGVGISGKAELCAIGNLDVNRRGNGIHLWNCRDVILSENTVSRTRDGIYFSFADNCQVLRNVVTDCRYGLHYMYSDDNSFSQNRFTDNAAGAALMYSGRLQVRENYFTANQGGRAYGLLLQSVDGSFFHGNRFYENTVGLYSENSQDNRFTENIMKNNYVALRLGGSSRDNEHAGNDFSRNTHRVEVNGDPRDNEWSMEGRGNRWGGMAVSDLDRNGIGELPHWEADLLGPLRQRFPLAGLLSGSPGLEILRFARSRTEIPGIRAIEDPHPLVSSHD